MILVFEMVWTETHHAPGNSVTVQTIARALPEQEIRVYADLSHLTELRRDGALTAFRQVSFHAAPVSPHFRHRPHIVSVRRGLHEFATIWHALRQVPRGEPCLVYLISATPTCIAAAAAIARIMPQVKAVQVGMHGNLSEITGWRSRNPLVRAFDLPSVMSRGGMPKLRYLVLEEAIRRELARIAPAAARRTDVLPLPVNQAEMDLAPDQVLCAPIRVGFVGQATEAKGITPFLAVVEHVKARYGDAILFEVIGRAPPGSDLARFRVLDGPPTHEHLSREAFCARMAGLHYVCLPFQPGYYNLSASGAFIDAMTWLKPVIACHVPIVEDIFAQFGDLGYLCDDADAMSAVFDDIMTRPDPVRYAAQIEALRCARAARMPEALAQDYRAIVARGFPGFAVAQQRAAAHPAGARAGG